MNVFAEDLEREDRVLVLGPAMSSVRSKVGNEDCSQTLSARGIRSHA